MLAQKRRVKETDPESGAAGPHSSAVCAPPHRTRRRVPQSAIEPPGPTRLRAGVSAERSCTTGRKPAGEYRCSMAEVKAGRCAASANEIGDVMRLMRGPVASSWASVSILQTAPVSLPADTPSSARSSCNSRPAGIRGGTNSHSAISSPSSRYSGGPASGRPISPWAP